MVSGTISGAPAVPYGVFQPLKWFLTQFFHPDTISPPRKCARAGKPDYRRVFQKVGNLQVVDFRRWSKRSEITEPQVADFGGGCKSRFAAFFPDQNLKRVAQSCSAFWNYSAAFIFSEHLHNTITNLRTAE
jgi:hypothetical protein